MQKWLDDVNARYGGVDSILMWPTYTNIGTDDRSQFDVSPARSSRSLHKSSQPELRAR